MKVVTIVGTRPELIKLSEIIKKLDKHIQHIFVHTGQNYSYELNEIFYKDLDLRKPDYSLDVAGNTLGETIGSIIKDTEWILTQEKPDAVLILGDTNSALAGIIAKRMKIPLFHLEAGNRCFDDNVPEEINRRILDHIADVNMVYTEHARRYLLDEGIAKDRIFVMGSPMREIMENHWDQVKKSTVLDDLELKPYKYFVVSIHRDENIEIPINFDKLIEAINQVADTYQLPIILSAHPRFMKRSESSIVLLNPLVSVCKPFSFFDYLYLQYKSKCVLSDSGTISEESSLLNFPAITIRNAIERPEAIDFGSILMSGVEKESIMRCLKAVSEPMSDTKTLPVGYEVDNCSDRVLKVILGYTDYVNRKVWGK